MGEYDEELKKCIKIKKDIHALIDELIDDEEYLERLKKFIKFKVVDNQNKSNTHL
jgi:hypothetical protein